MKTFVIKHRYYLICQVIVLALFFFYTELSEAGLNDGDSITHYFISRYSWQYPHLFLDNWGKPFFVLLSSPFAQFGYRGIQVFNIICAVFSGWFCYRTADLLGIKFPFTAPFFLITLPVYFIAIPSGLTEILFGLVLILSIYFLLKNQNLAAAILISFLPFCRSEGLLLIPLFGIMLLIREKYKIIPFLGTAYLVYSLVGWHYFHDLLWVMHTNPYHGVDIYGHGPLMYFVNANRLIFGNVCGILFLIATAGYFLRKKPDTKIEIEKLNFERIIIWGTVLVYFIAHSIFWYKGLFGSAGMWRVMAAIAPAFVLIAMRGLTTGTSFFENRKWIYYPLWIFMIGFVIYHPVSSLDLPQHLDERKTTIKKACDWVKENGLATRKIYFSDPFIKLLLELNPFDDKISKELMYVDRQNFGSDMEPKSIIIWDAGLGKHEDQIPLVKLEDTTRFKILKSFEAPHDMDQGVKYAVYVLERK